MRLALAVLATVSALQGAYAAIAADEVLSLPGYSANLPSKLYSGYLDVGGGRLYHYMLSLSRGNPTTDPVALALNGGPGCSSLESFFAEHGPYWISDSNHSQLYDNPWTINSFSSFLALESPAGVGMSVNPSNIAFNDSLTASDNYDALLQFFAGFPELSANPFWITGESYAGVYIPTLAAAIVAGNKAGNPKINLAGIAVGNGCTGNEVGTCGPLGDFYRFTYMASHTLISEHQWAAINATCKNWANESPACQALLEATGTAIGNVNIYDLDSPCIDDWSDDDAGAKFSKPLPKWARNQLSAQILGGPDGCIDASALHHYLDAPGVPEALHTSSMAKYWSPWQVCSETINYTPTAQNLPRDVYPGLINAGLKVLIFNGDFDLCVPENDNEAWTYGMGYPVKNAWASWSINEGTGVGNQVAGYLTQFTVPNGSFAFATVKGAGHMVPEFQPQSAFQMYKNLLTGAW